MLNDTTPTSWVTFYTVRLADGRLVLTQKKDGATRAIVTGARR